MSLTTYRLKEYSSLYLICSVLFLFIGVIGRSQEGFNTLYPHSYFIEQSQQIIVKDGVVYVYSTARIPEGQDGFAETKIDPTTGLELSHDVLEVFYQYSMKRESVLKVDEEHWLWSGDSGVGACVYYWDSELNLVWSIQQAQGEYSPAVRKENGNYLVVYVDLISEEVSMVEFNVNGEILTETLIPAIVNSDIRVRQLEILPDERIVIGGIVSSWNDQINTFEQDNCIILLDSDYSVLWEDRWGGNYFDGDPYTFYHELSGTIVTASEEMLFSEEVQFGLLSELLIQQRDPSNGIVVDSFSFGSDTLMNASLNDLKRTADGGFIVVGEAWMNIPFDTFTYSFATKFDEDLQEEWTRYYYHDIENDWSNCLNAFGEVEQLDNGGYAFAGLYLPFDDDDTVNAIPWLVVTDACGLVQEECVVSVPEENSFGFSVYPNPAHSRVNIVIPSFNGDETLTLFNAMGEQIETRQVKSPNEEMDLMNLSAGVYFISLTDANGQSAVQRVVVD